MHRRCSFCQRPQDEVTRLIAGSPGIYICEECVGRCSEVLREPHGAVQAAPAEAAGAADLTAVLRRVRLIAMDVDGCLTDGRITYVPVPGDPEGAVVEEKSFAVRDGLAIKWASKVGLVTAVVTARGSAPVERRARELSVTHVIQGARHKGDAIRLLAEEVGVGLDEAAFLGDDLQDASAMRIVGLPVAPADACPEVLALAKLVTRARGGHGAAREMIETILRAQGLWERVLEGHE